MEGEKRIPLEIFDELAGVKETSQEVKFGETIVLFPKLTKINYAYLKETSNAFFSKVFKDFNKGLFDFFTFYQTLAYQKKEDTPGVFRTTVNFLKKAKEVWDFIDTINSLINVFDFISNRLAISKDRGAADIGNKIRKILSPFIKVKEKILNFFSFKREELDNGVRPNNFKGKKPPKISTTAPKFKPKKGILIGTLLTVGGLIAVNKASDDMSKGNVVSEKSLSTIDEELKSSFSSYSLGEQFQGSKDIFFPLLAQEYEKAGNMHAAAMLKPLNYDLSAMPSMDELLGAHERQPLSRLLSKSAKILPWLKLWYHFINLAKEGIVLKSQRKMYEDAISELKEENKEFLSELNPDISKMTEMYAEPGEYKELTLDDFADAITLREVIKVSQKAKVNFMTETKDLQSIKQKEIDAQRDKCLQWMNIFRLLSLKLNNQ